MQNTQVVQLKTTVELLLHGAVRSINHNIRDPQLGGRSDWVLWPRSLDEIQGHNRRRYPFHILSKTSAKTTCLLAYSASVKNNAKCMLCWRRRPKTDGLRGRRPVTPCEKIKCADSLQCNANNGFFWSVLSCLINAFALKDISDAYYVA